MKLNELTERSEKIRERYHQFEIKSQGCQWTVEQDVLAFLTDAGLVGRLVMSHQERWPVGGNEKSELEHKLGESVWWLAVLANRTGVDVVKAIEQFLKENITELQELKTLSLELRDNYHNAEIELHGSSWTIEEDALAFLTDAALIGRMVMAQQNSWPLAQFETEDLEHKLAESIWWLMVLANRMEYDIEKATERFLSTTEQMLV